MSTELFMGFITPIQVGAAKYSTRFLAFLTLFFAFALTLGTITYSISGNLSKLDNAVVQYAGAQGDEIAVGEGDETEGDENRTKVVETAQARIVNVLTIDSVNPEAPIAGVDKVRVEGRTSTTLGFIEVIWGDQEVQKRVEISSGSGYGVWSAEHMYGDSSVGNRQIVVKWWSEDPYGNSVNDVKSYTVNVGSPSVLYPTNLEIDPILDASLDGPTKVGGSLIDDETGEGIENVEITFDGSGADGLSSVTTNEDGKFSAEGTAPATLGTGWEVQAHFAGISDYQGSESNVETYDTEETTLYQTTLELESISDAPVSGSINAKGSLIDDETGEGIENVEITFDGSGADGLSSVTTNEDGKFSTEGTAPDTVGTGWEVQAHFAGESEYDAADSVPASYGTQPAPTNDPDRPTPGTTDVNPGQPDVNPEPTVVPEPEPEFASPDNPIPPEQPQSWPTELLLIVGLTVAAVVIAIAVKLQKGKSGKDNLEVVDEVITRSGTEK